MLQIGVIGAGRCDEKIYRTAFRVGQLIAERGHVLINGGLGGVMEASARGAKSRNGTVVAVLPGKMDYCNEFSDIRIATDMGHARNVIIVHSSDALISVGGGYGTISEIAIALKEGKKVASLYPPVVIDGMKVFETPEEAVDYCISDS
ncbi:TIGR00725 family protein [Archaeoglobus neptunius]|uniref:TIGR00725 family protein n=1 Tax=Archaeoglobus neptunius TaxID=2798580 RepID=UPI001926AF8D|nr:TIGR00725 family protein [Archaeoglobus neptunius]